MYFLRTSSAPRNVLGTCKSGYNTFLTGKPDSSNAFPIATWLKSDIVRKKSDDAGSGLNSGNAFSASQKHNLPHFGPSPFGNVL